MSETVGPYTLDDLLAMGSHSAVWLGRGPAGRVVVKVARGDHQPALRREQAILRAASHQNLVQMIDADPAGGWIAFVHVDGLHVDAWAQGSPTDAIIDKVSQLVDAVDYLHEQGIVHGDLKPSNVIVGTDGVVRLLDLGIASPIADAPTETKGSFKGTIGFAAPELLRGAPPSVATDVYGLGALLYAVFTHRAPFVAQDPAALTYLPLVSLPAPPATFQPELPGPLNQLVLSMLCRDPERRPPGMKKVREALEKCKGALPGSPILGMLEERDALRRAVVGASDGESRVVVMYGVPGSGRRTLLAEAVEYARREGMPYLKGTAPATALDAMRDVGRPAVLVMKATHRGTRQLAETMLKEGLGGLLLLHADRPLPGLSGQGAIQVTPAPLSLQDSVRLARVWSADLQQAEVWWRESMGLPIAVLARIRGWRRARGLTQTQHAPLPSESRKVYEALRAKPKMRCAVTELASDLEMPEHTFLDHCEVLFAEELIEPADDGMGIVVARSRSVL